jgi:hypothetical protein
VSAGKIGLVVLVVASGVGAARAADGPPPTSFDGPAVVSTTEGHTTLAWSPRPDGAVHGSFQLEASDDPSFDDGKLRYEGPDRASFVSGLPEGTTWFRVRAVGDDGTAGPWSDAVRVDVAYPERGQVVRFLVLGSIVFLATVTAVIVGHRRHRRQQA